MADVINLRKARKAKARSEAEARAIENRILHGLTKGEKAAIALEQQRRDQHLNGLRLIGAASPETSN